MFKGGGRSGGGSEEVPDSNKVGLMVEVRRGRGRKRSWIRIFFTNKN